MRSVGRIMCVDMGLEASTAGRVLPIFCCSFCQVPVDEGLLVLHDNICLPIARRASR